MNSMPNTTTLANRLRTDDMFAGYSDDVHIDNMVCSLLEDQKHLDSKYFFDSTGVQLYQEICLSGDFYPDRIELYLLRSQVIPRLTGFKNLEIVDMGPGETLKVKTLIRSLRENGCQIRRYIPVNFSKAANRTAANMVRDLFPKNGIVPVHTDFTGYFDLPATDMPRVYCVFGGPPGNLMDSHGIHLMKALQTVMHEGDILLAGLDLKKAVPVMERAYNDRKGLMAAFNKNILSVVNRVTGSFINADEFDHRASYNPEHSRMEMHLVAGRDMNLHLRKAGLILGMCRGETILTATAKKYTPDDIRAMAIQSDLSLQKIHCDDRKWYAIAEFIKK